MYLTSKMDNPQEMTCKCGHTESEHYPQHLFMNGCKKETCDCLEYEPRLMSV